MRRALIASLFLFSAARADDLRLGPIAARGITPPFAYPPTERRDVVERRFGYTVTDPYRWLEDGRDARVLAWAQAQDRLMRAQVARAPGRDALVKRLRELAYIDQIGVPVRAGGRLFFDRLTARGEKVVVYVREPDGRERALLDPLQISPDGNLSIDTWVASWDGKKVAYTRNPNGADEGVLYVRDVETGKDLPQEHIAGVNWGVISWNSTSDGLYYVVFPSGPSVPPTERIARAEVRFHRLGGDARRDPVVHAATGSPKLFPSCDASRDGHWLFHSIERGAESNDLYVRDLRKPGSPFQPIAVGLPAKTDVEAFGDRFFVHTTHRAPRGRVLLVEAAGRSLDEARELVPEDGEAQLESMSVQGGRLVLRNLRHAASELEVRELDGKPVRKVALPGIGSVESVRGSPDSDEMFYGFTSFTTALQVFRGSLQTGKSELWAEVKVPIDASPYLSELVWYPSRDGTSVSMFIVRRKDLPRDGSSPFVLTGYGGFAVSLTPSFSLGPWLESGGAIAIPNLRGGGEYGERWHLAGVREHKQNVFDDFVAAAEYLIKNGYTRTEHLVVEGASNGGLLVGAVATQRPDLFRAVVCGVPLLDMLRYTEFGIAKVWSDEYGSPDVEADFRFLAAYSPYHRVRPAAYPAMLFLSADSDDRADPLHARKMVAALQAANTGPSPILLRVESHAGHNGADARAAAIEEMADRSLFLYRTLGFPPRNDLPWLAADAKPAPGRR